MKKPVLLLSVNILLVALAMFIIFFLAGVPWQAFDYIFSVVFHGFMLSLIIFLFTVVLYVLFTALRVLGKVVPPESESAARRAIDFFFHASDACRSILSALFTLYCTAALVAGAAINPPVGAAFLLCAVAAGVIQRKKSDTAAARFLPAGAMVVTVAAVSVGMLVYADSPVSPGPLALAAAYIYAGLRRPGGREILPVREGASPWLILSRNRIRLALIGALLFPMHLLWLPGLDVSSAVDIVEENAVAGPANKMIFTPDGGGIVLLDKSRPAARLLDRATLLEKASVAMRKNPRDIVYDEEKGVYYAVMHSIAAEQLIIINAATFTRTGAVSVPIEECTQINAVELDRVHNRILIGCDSSGQIFYLDRDTMKPHSDILEPTKPNGKGIVRLIVDEARDRVITIGCVLGPYFNVIDLAEWQLTEFKYTGYLTWEYARDETTGRLFISVPFRSMVVIVDEETLDVKGVIRSGLGARALAVDRAGRRLFVGDQIAGTLRVFDLDTLRLESISRLYFPRYFLYDEVEGMLYASTAKGLFKIKI